MKGFCSPEPSYNERRRFASPEAGFMVVAEPQVPCLLSWQAGQFGGELPGLLGLPVGP